jgi:hypothetical protein
MKPKVVVVIWQQIVEIEQPLRRLFECSIAVRMKGTAPD